MSLQSQNRTTAIDVDSSIREAMALQQAGDLTGAVEKYESLLNVVPDNPHALSMCALAKSAMGEDGEALKMLEKSVSVVPGFADGWNNLGVLRQRLGDKEGAAEAYLKVCEINPDSLLGHFNYANICQVLEKFGPAIDAYEKAVAINSNEAAIWSNLARSLLFEGHWQRAYDATSKALELSPGHIGTIALRSDAALELGYMDEWSKLVDFDRFIKKTTFSPPPGYEGLEAFNEALCAHCNGHPTLEYEPSENSTVNGHHTGNLSKDENQGPIGELLEIITNAVREYQTEHPPDSSHPFLTNIPENWTYDIWAVIMGRQGHQDAHIHRSGWLSGCYYPKIPPSIREDDESQAGWIEFGQPQHLPLAKAQPEVRAYAPTAGMVVLFPSYFYHRTIPYDSDETRVSIAFDIVPTQ